LKLLGKLFGRSKRSDYSEVIHVEIAQKLVETRELIATNPMPIEFGGAEGLLNTVYLPPSAIEKFNIIIERLRNLAEAGEIDHLSVRQEHRGASIVPTRLYFVCSHGDQEGLYNLKVDVW